MSLKINLRRKFQVPVTQPQCSHQDLLYQLQILFYCHCKIYSRLMLWVQLGVKWEASVPMLSKSLQILIRASQLLVRILWSNLHSQSKFIFMGNLMILNLVNSFCRVKSESSEFRFWELHCAREATKQSPCCGKELPFGVFTKCNFCPFQFFCQQALLQLQQQVSSDRSTER